MTPVVERERCDGALILHPDGTPSWRYALEPFQQAFYRSGLTQDAAGKRCGFVTGYFGRILGLRGYRDGRGYWTVARTLSYENAVKIATGLDLDFVELGI